MSEPIPLSTEQFNRRMIRLTEFFDPVIQQKKIETPSIWRNMQPVAGFPLGQGFIRKIFKFFPGMDEQGGATTWTAITSYREPGTNGPEDPGVDPCKYTARVLNWGFNTETYSGYQTARRSPHFCINDFLYDWQFAEQLKMIIDSFGDNALQIWETFGREMYLNFATKRILGSNPYAGDFTYTPLTSKNITIPVGTVSALTSKHLDAIWQLLSLQVGQKGAVANDSGSPVYGLELNPFDWDDVIKQDSGIREDFRYGDPGVLIKGVGTFKTYRGFGHMYHQTPPRFKIVSQDATNITLERVNPYDEESVTQGSKFEPSVDYLKAQYALATVVLKDVFEKQIPPAPPSKIAGASFNANKSDGTLQWVNNRNDDTNPLGEKGYFFSKFAMFAKPLVNSDYAMTLLYKRFPNTPIFLNELAPGATAGAKAVIGVTAIDPDGTLAYFQVRVTLAAATLGVLQQANQTITVTFDDATTATALIADDSDAPTGYVLTFATAADWVNNGGGIASILSA